MMDRRSLLLAIAAQSATWKDEAFSPLNGSLAPAKAKGPFKLGKLIGRTLAVNQLIKFDRPTTTTNGITFTNNGNGSITVSGTATAQATFPIPYSTNYPDLVAGHKYLLIGCPAGGSYTTYDLRANNLATTFEGGAIVTTSTSGKDSVYILVRNGVTLNVTFYPRLYDLTLMFGPGREPTTIDEFKQVYSRENTAYTLGQLESALVAAIIARKTDSTEKSRLELPNDLTLNSALDAKDTFEVVGENAVFTKNAGTVDLGTLNYVYSNGTFRPTNLTNAKQATSYGAIPNMISSKYIAVSNQTLDGGADKSISITDITSSYIIRIRDTNYTDATAFKTAMVGQNLNYELATPQTITIPMKKLQAVTIGELAWNYDSVNHLIHTNSLQGIIKNAPDNVQLSNIYCSEYITDNVSHLYSSSYDKIISVSQSGTVFVKDTSYASAADFVAARGDDVIWFESVNDQAEWNAGTCEAGGEFETGYVSPDAVLKTYEKK